MNIGIEKIITDIVKDFSITALDKTLEIGTKQYKKALVTLELCFGKYLKRSFARYSRIKTLLYRDRPVDLKAHYVPTDFHSDGVNICGKNIFDSFQECKKNIVVGTAGSGKSVLLRRLFIDLVENPRGIVPILIELRILETPDNDHTIYDYVHKTLSDLDEGFTRDQLHFALKEGKLALFLDGFDEIDFSKKEKYEREVLDLSNKYDKSIIVVSSRPDECFSAWDEFHVFHALPLNQNQSIDLISRIEYDRTVKEKFITELKSGLYDKHRDFLSNPLLLTMMLLTYEQLAEIPEKIHIFYEQAFDTLYHKHDALKALYKRKSYSNLPIDDFKRIFSAFCVITYSDRKMSFTYLEIIEYLEKAISIEDFNVNPREFFNDLIKSVCIIQKDGNIYTFSHRSFQEYFAAFFISKSQSIDTGKVLDTISKGHFTDNVISILYELNKEKVETKWIIPRLEESLEKCKEHYESGNLIDFLSVFYNEFSCHDTGIGFLLTEDKYLGYYFLIISRIYSEEYSSLYKDEKIAEDNLSEEERNEQGNNEVALFLKHTCLEGPNGNILFSDMPSDLEWLKDTWVPSNCEKRYQFMESMHEKLRLKYSKKANSLSELLLN